MRIQMDIIWACDVSLQAQIILLFYSMALFPRIQMQNNKSIFRNILANGIYLILNFLHLQGLLKSLGFTLDLRHVLSTIALDFDFCIHSSL